MVIGAVDIGGTKIAVGLVNAEGRILTQVSCPTEPEKGFEHGLVRICRMLRQCLEQLPDESLAGIGIGCTGPVDPFSGVLGINNFLAGWEDNNLVERLKLEMNVPTVVENDADAAALAEVRWGSGQDASRCLYVTVSTGIGCGIVVDGVLYRGVGGAHPEIGHHVIDPSGPHCFCGANGCWEILASGTALAAWYNEQTGGTGDRLADARQVCWLAEQGDLLAKAALDREAYYLGLGLANLVTMFTPDVIILGGGVMESWRLFSARVRDIIRSTCGLVPHEKTQLRRASLGIHTGLAGAAAVWFHRYANPG